jgi:hypothetical protein
VQDTSHLHIEFYVTAEEDPVATRAEGVPKFKDVEMVRIRFVGDRNQEVVAPAHAKTFDPEERIECTYAEKFPRHYAAFKETGGGFIDGTPIEELPGITSSKVAEFKAQKVFSIEALAQIEGAALTRLGMFGRDWKNKATAWIAAAKEGAIDAKLAAQNADLMAQLKAMQDRLDAMGAAPAKAKDAEEAPKVPVVEAGPFAGHTAADLRTFVKAKGGTIKGNPSLDTLLAMAVDIMAAEVTENV